MKYASGYSDSANAKRYNYLKFELFRDTEITNILKQRQFSLLNLRRISLNIRSEWHRIADRDLGSELSSELEFPRPDKTSRIGL